MRAFFYEWGVVAIPIFGLLCGCMSDAPSREYAFADEIENGRLYNARSILKDDVADLKDRYGRSILYVCAERRDEDAVRFLLERGADPKRKENNGYSVYSRAVKTGNLAVLEELLKHGTRFSDEERKVLFCDFLKSGKIELAKKVLEGMSADLSGRDGMSALYFSVEKGDMELISFLLDKGANPYRQEVNGETIISHAIKSRNEVFLRILLNRNFQFSEDDRREALGIVAASVLVKNEGVILDTSKHAVGEALRASATKSNVVSTQSVAFANRPAVVLPAEKQDDKIRALAREKKNLEEFLISEMPESYRLLQKIKEMRKDQKERMRTVRKALLALSSDPDDEPRMKQQIASYNRKGYALALLRIELEDHYIATLVGEHGANIKRDLEIAKRVTSVLDGKDEKTKDSDFSLNSQSQIAQEYMSGIVSVSEERLNMLVDEDALFYIAVNTVDSNKIIFCVNRITDTFVLERIVREAKNEFARRYAKSCL